MKIYNIAYVPRSTQDLFIKLASSADVTKEGYCLAEDSYPHITICQFNFNSKDDLNLLWEDVCYSIEHLSIQLTFQIVSDITFNDKLYWISLLPMQVDELHRAYEIISKKVEQKRKDKYDPHLTLFNYLKKDMKKVLNPVDIFPIKDDFDLILGESDEIGQLKNIIFTSEISSLDHLTCLK